MEERNIFEICVNGNVVTVVDGSYDDLENAIEHTINKYVTRGGQQIVSRESGNKAYYIYFNESTLQCTVIMYRTRFGFTDCNGEYIYEGDSIIDNLTNKVWELNEHSILTMKESPYYIRQTHGWMQFEDHDITPEEITERFMVQRNECTYPNIVCGI